MQALAAIVAFVVYLAILAAVLYGAAYVIGLGLKASGVL